PGLAGAAKPGGGEIPRAGGAGGPGPVGERVPLRRRRVRLLRGGQPAPACGGRGPDRRGRRRGGAARPGPARREVVPAAVGDGRGERGGPPAVRRPVRAPLTGF